VSTKDGGGVAGSRITLPAAVPDSAYRRASATCDSGHTRATCALISPLASRSKTAPRPARSAARNRSGLRASPAHWWKNVARRPFGSRFHAVTPLTTTVSASAGSFTSVDTLAWTLDADARRACAGAAGGLTAGRGSSRCRAATAKRQRRPLLYGCPGEERRGLPRDLVSWGALAVLAPGQAGRVRHAPRRRGWTSPCGRPQRWAGRHPRPPPRRTAPVDRGPVASPRRCVADSSTVDLAEILSMFLPVDNGGSVGRWV
jgi:hypothetical protein